MSTTLLFVELIIIGLQVTVWLVLVVLLFLGHDWISPTQLSKWQGLGSVLLLAFAYTVGTLFDRLTDRIFKRWHERIKAREFPDPPAALVAIRYEVAKDNEYLNRLFEYTRSRMRISRATVVNAPVIALLLVTYYLIWMDSWSSKEKLLICGLTLAFGLFFVVLAIQAWNELMRTYVKLIKQNYEAARDIPVEEPPAQTQGAEQK